MKITRLSSLDAVLARDTCAMMGAAFEEPNRLPLGEDYLTELLDRDETWIYAALIDHQPVGGLIAHVLPMTRSETTELLLYDIAVQTDRQRHGIGRALVRRLLADAAANGIPEVWVPADNQDAHALDFYLAIGGRPQTATIFTYAIAD